MCDLRTASIRYQDTAPHNKPAKVQRTIGYFCTVHKFLMPNKAKWCVVGYAEEKKAEMLAELTAGGVT